MKTTPSILKWIFAFLIVGCVIIIHDRFFTPMAVDHKDTDTVVLTRIEVDTLYKIDTLFQTKLKVKEIKSIDTIIVKDTLLVREQKTYGDSLYTAWISGYDACLDSIRLYNRTSLVKTIKTKEIHVKTRDCPISFGVQAGYGYPCGAYIGIGISYRISRINN